MTIILSDVTERSLEQMAAALDPDGRGAMGRSFALQLPGLALQVHLVGVAVQDKARLSDPATYEVVFQAAPAPAAQQASPAGAPTQKETPAP